LTVYIDIIFLENLFMNYIIIFATGIIIKAEIKIIRTFLSSFIGSVYAVIVYTNILKNITSNVILKIILSVVMIYVAFKPFSLKIFIKQLIIFYLTSFTFGGVAFALLYFISPQKILMEKGVLIGTYPIKIILCGGILGFIIITTAFKNIKGKISKKDMFCNAKININNNSVYLKVIIDTGNFLKEPITKIPVIVVEKQVFNGIIPDNILNNLYEIINGEEIDIGEYSSKIRLIPFTSLGKQNGMLLGIKADSMIVSTDEKNIFVKNIIIGLYDGILSKSGKYKGLVGLEILEDKGGSINNEYIRNIKV
jgi:stage II sporulation protein GA (sporulation sigma-E factor processing peptidase)